jgi:DNA replication protein DnaC
MVASTANVKQALDGHLRELHLPTVRAGYEAAARQAEAETLSYEQYLLGLAERECEVRRHNRVERLLRQSKLPLEKNLASLDLSRLPAKARRQIRTLLDGSFVDRQENVLAFGTPGGGKTHGLCAIGQELIRRSGGRRKVYFTPCALMVQDLLIASECSRILRGRAAFPLAFAAENREFPLTQRGFDHAA